MSAEAFIWIHAQNEKDSTIHRSMAQRGAWIEFDGLNDNNVTQYLTFLRFAKVEGFLNKVLISHDAGWYHVGEIGGGQYRGYTTLQSQLLPAMQQEGFTTQEIDLITRENPSKAFAIKVRKH